MILKKTVFLLATLLLVSSCGFDTPLTLQQKIRMFFYENQIKAGSEFVEWADNNLDEYTHRSVMDALYEEGKYHARLGHPNAIGVISFAAQDWANAHHLRYNTREWQALQEEALANLRPPVGEVQIWPK